VIDLGGALPLASRCEVRRLLKRGPFLFSIVRPERDELDFAGPLFVEKAEQVFHSLELVVRSWHGLAVQTGANERQVSTHCVTSLSGQHVRFGDIGPLG